jgi:hypothetical protein
MGKIFSLSTGWVNLLSELRASSWRKKDSSWFRTAAPDCVGHLLCPLFRMSYTARTFTAALPTKLKLQETTRPVSCSNSWSTVVSCDSVCALQFKTTTFSDQTVVSIYMKPIKPFKSYWELYVPPTLTISNCSVSVYVFHIILSVNSDYFLKRR